MITATPRQGCTLPAGQPARHGASLETPRLRLRGAVAAVGAKFQTRRISPTHLSILACKAHQEGQPEVQVTACTSTRPCLFATTAGRHTPHLPSICHTCAAAFAVCCRSACVLMAAHAAATKHSSRTAAFQPLCSSYGSRLHKAPHQASSGRRRMLHGLRHGVRNDVLQWSVVGSGRVLEMSGICGQCSDRPEGLTCARQRAVAAVHCNHSRACGSRAAQWCNQTLCPGFAAMIWVKLAVLKWQWCD